MNTLHARPNYRHRAPARPAPLRIRADLPTVSAPSHALRVITAAHDFLVPNPRPDLTADPHTLRMLEAG